MSVGVRGRVRGIGGVFPRASTKADGKGGCGARGKVSSTHVCTARPEAVWVTVAVQAVTFAAALNDVGSWALVSWHATFYQRVFELGPETYAPLLAVVIPVGGIVGGVGGGLTGDWLSRIGGRAWLTSGGTQFVVLGMRIGTCGRYLAAAHRIILQEGKAVLSICRGLTSQVCSPAPMTCSS
jgi:hypothetical protein